MTIEDIALTMTPGLGVRGVVHLLDVFGSAEKIFGASNHELLHFGALQPMIVEAIVERRGFAAAEREVAYCKRHSIKIIASTDDAYPPLLREATDYPHVIYVIGNVEALHGRCVSIVGTRKISHYGQRVCAELVRDLSKRLRDLTVVSGLAFGIDGEAHRAAIYHDVPTVAVVANALPSVTPAHHTSLAREIIEQGGAIVSELPSSTKPCKSLYIARNRIVAALSGVTVVVESSEKGGSLSTANIADGYGRVVMAVPGRVTDESSRGTNRLIRNNQAMALLGAEDLIRAMMWDLESEVGGFKPEPAQLPQMSIEQLGLLGCFRSDDPLSLAELMELSQLNVGELTAMLLEMEMLGIVRMLPGSRYEALMKITNS